MKMSYQIRQKRYRSTKVLSVRPYQTGEIKSISRDRRYKALKSGKRRSRPNVERKYYYETRKNRSDSHGDMK